jgi:hypothetical protein
MHVHRVNPVMRRPAGAAANWLVRPGLRQGGPGNANAAHAREPDSVMTEMTANGFMS